MVLKAPLELTSTYLKPTSWQVWQGKSVLGSILGANE